jgi:hypothetical protein
LHGPCTHVTRSCGRGDDKPNLFISGIGTPRPFAAMPKFGRDRSEADMGGCIVPIISAASDPGCSLIPGLGSSSPSTILAGSRVLSAGAAQEGVRQRPLRFRTIQVWRKDTLQPLWSRLSLRQTDRRDPVGSGSRSPRWWTREWGGSPMFDVRRRKFITPSAARAKRYLNIELLKDQQMRGAITP